MIIDDFKSLVYSNDKLSEEQKANAVEKYNKTKDSIIKQEENIVIFYNKYNIYIDYNDYIKLIKDSLIYIKNYDIWEYERYNVDDLLTNEDFELIPNNNQETLDIHVGVETDTLKIVYFITKGIFTKDESEDK